MDSIEIEISQSKKEVTIRTNGKCCMYAGDRGTEVSAAAYLSKNNLKLL